MRNATMPGGVQDMKGHVCAAEVLIDVCAAELLIGAMSKQKSLTTNARPSVFIGVAHSQSCSDTKVTQWCPFGACDTE